MMSLSGDSVKWKNTAYPKPSQNHANGAAVMDTEQMFRLIDSVLPFEACLYYQILPLSLEGRYLKLGMVNPEDISALDYARRILAYLNCSLKPQPIASETHQAMLSAYLNHIGKSKLAQGKIAKNPSPPPQTDERNERPTLIVNSPEELLKSEAQTTDSQTTIPQIANSPEKGKAFTPNKPESTLEKISRKVNQSSLRPDPHAPQPLMNLPILEVQGYHLSRPIEVLATLPPSQLLQELLSRVLMGGIGRLYFERQTNQGRILWSQDGVLQSVLDELSLPVFQGVINELKRLAHLPFITVKEPKQVEIERQYQNNRLLLRLRVMPGKQGEEATLQVLRGAALKFYQQQQLENLSRDALTLAQQLQIKLNEIRDRTRLNPSLNTSHSDSLTALYQLVEMVDKQLEALKELQEQQKPQDESAS